MAVFKTLVLTIYTFLLALFPQPSYIEGTVGQPQSFLPSVAQTQTDKTISSLIYRGLFRYDIYGQTVPDLADTWIVSDDGLVYTIKLKDNQYWTNGKKITSDDLIYTSFKVADLSGVATDKVDDLTVRYTLPNKYAPFLSLLTVGIMPLNAEEKGSQLKPTSSGDFRVAQIDRTGKHIRQITLITTNSSYDIKRIAFKFYTDENELETAAKLGEINGFLATKEHKISNFYDYRFPVQGIYYALFFNLRNEKLQDQAFRQKLDKALPVKDLVANKGIAAQGPISRSVFTDRDLVFNNFDPDFIEDIDNVSLTITVPDVDSHVLLAKQVADIWRSKLGIDVKVKIVSPQDIVSSVIEPRDYEVLFYGQEVGRDPDRYVLWHSAQKNPPGLNIAGFDQVRADRALEAGRNELDNEKRIVHYDEFQKVIADQIPAIFLYHPYTHFYVSKYISDIGEKYTFTYADRFLDFKNWKFVRTN